MSIDKDKLYRYSLGVGSVEDELEIESNFTEDEFAEDLQNFLFEQWVNTCKSDYRQGKDLDFILENILEQMA